MARARGSRVYVCTRDERQRELARELGATWVGGASDATPDPCDSAIIFAPAGELVPAALAALAPGGTLALAGIVMSDVPRLQYAQHLFREKSVRSVTANTRLDAEELLREAAAAGVAPRLAPYELEQANEALIALKHDGVRGTGVLRVVDLRRAHHDGTSRNTARVALSSSSGSACRSRSARSGRIYAGRRLPGHGGLLDRVDSVMLVTSILWIASSV